MEKEGKEREEGRGKNGRKGKYNGGKRQRGERERERERRYLGSIKGGKEGARREGEKECWRENC